MRIPKLTPIWLTALLAISGCGAPVMAQFCDVARGPIQFDNPSSVPALTSFGERESLVQIDANNRTGERHCGWVVQ